MRVSVALAVLLLGGCAAGQPALRDDRFVIVDDWLRFVTDRPGDTTAARNVFQSMRGRR